MMEILTGLIKEIWHTFSTAAPYIIFGTFMAGFIHIFFDREKVVKHLGKPGLKSVFLAALFGIPLPLCSCGVLPTAMSLRKSGASKGATLSFLISTPETGIDSIFLTYALLDPLMTVFRPFAALITALVAGISENLFGKKEKPAAAPKEEKCVFCEENGHEHAHAHSFFSKFAHSMEYAFVDLLGDIALWLTLGIIAGGVISYFVPASLIENYLGYDLRAMFIMLLIGIPLYICASASTPIAAALIAKGMSPGVALVFLLAGPATNTAGIITIAKFLGKRTVVIYLLAISACTIGMGLLLNYIYKTFHIDIMAVLGKGSHMHLAQDAGLVAGPLLIILMINALRRKIACPA
ncbi:MAG: SO_0444 family Cu/Zn efflux transporter [Candidatus Omnitrophica bacterium]|nr:SO_0444 family Cu/Zn efflux transporter [Candidatus Omnitrophota bacterium]